MCNKPAVTLAIYTPHIFCPLAYAKQGDFMYKYYDLGDLLHIDSIAKRYFNGLHPSTKKTIIEHGQDIHNLQDLMEIVDFLEGR